MATYNLIGERVKAKHSKKLKKQIKELHKDYPCVMIFKDENGNKKAVGFDLNPLIL